MLKSMLMRALIPFLYTVIAIFVLSCAGTGEQYSKTTTTVVISKEEPQNLLMAISGSPGSEREGDIDLDFSYASDLKKIGKLIVKQKEGKTPPSENCQDGILVGDFEDPLAVRSHTVHTGEPGDAFSFRACLIDDLGEIVGTGALAGVVSKHVNVSSGLNSISAMIQRGLAFLGIGRGP